MPSSLSEPEIDHLVSEILEAMDSVRRAHYRMVWVAGGVSSERSRVLEAIALREQCPCLKVGRQLSGRLLDLPPRGRAAAAGDQFLDLLLASGSDTLCLDHLEILFDPVLRLQPVETVRNASRRFLIAASWPGEIDRSGLRFGPPGHPAHVGISLPMEGIPVISLA
jgi:hypothetical protein